LQLRTDDRSRVVRHGPSLPTTESLRSCLPTTYASRRRIPFVSLVRATARGCALSLLRVTALCRYPTDHDLRLPGTFLSITGNGRCEFPAYRHTDEYLTRHCLVPVSFRITNLADGSAASRSPLLLNPSQREIAFSCPFLRRVHGRPPCWTVLRHFLCYSPGAIVSELSVTPSHAIQDCRHSAARLRVVPTVCCITTRLLPLAGSVLPARLYCSAFHEHGQLRHLLLTMFGPSR